MHKFKIYWSFSFYGPWVFLKYYKGSSKQEAASYAHRLVNNHLAFIKIEEEINVIN